MLFGLLGRLKKYAEPAILLVLGVVIAGMVADKVADMLHKAGEGRLPASLMDLMDEKIHAAEQRSKDYADEKAANTEKLIISKHEELLRAVASVNNNVETLREGTKDSFNGVRSQIFELQRDLRRQGVVSYGR